MSDALASLRIWGVDFVLAGHTFRIPPRPAVDWVEAIMSDAMVDLLTEDDAERLTDLAADGQVDPAALGHVFTDVVTEASGREWHVATRLAALLMQDDLRGEVLSAIDPATRPLGAVLDVVYITCVRWKTDEQRAEFDAMILAPPESMPSSTSDPRERARQMREQSKRLLAERLSAATGTVMAEPVEASDAPSSETPPTSD